MTESAFASTSSDVILAANLQQNKTTFTVIISVFLPLIHFMLQTNARQASGFKKILGLTINDNK